MRVLGGVHKLDLERLSYYVRPPPGKPISALVPLLKILWKVIFALLTQVSTTTASSSNSSGSISSSCCYWYCYCFGMSVWIIPHVVCMPWLRVKGGKEAVAFLYSKEFPGSTKKCHVLYINLVSRIFFEQRIYDSDRDKWSFWEKRNRSIRSKNHA